MTQSPHEQSGRELHDQDAEPASQPDGAAASDGTEEEAAGDQDAGPASA